MNNLTASDYKPYSNHKQLYTNLSIAFGVFCFLSCIAMSYKKCFKSKKRKNDTKEKKFTPRKKQNTNIAPLDYDWFKSSNQNPLREKNKTNSNEEHSSSNNSKHKDISNQAGNDAWEMVEK
tara:strand:+ start:52 stop:414 length:363 start_codon:yes stop_codon:yes gene_type:complete